MKQLALLFAAVGLSACSIGKGVGAASGYIYEYGCNKNGDYGMTADGGAGPDNLAPYDLAPSFFAGEPIDDLRNYSDTSAIMSNRLIIRLQRSGKQIELNDVLTFDVPVSYEVARCVRGYVDQTGKKDWDETNCYRASDYGPGRLRVQWDAAVHAALTLHATCTANIVASAISAPVPLSYASTPTPAVVGGAWDSWVEFEEFGSARQDSVAPQDRGAVGNHFRVDYGERVYARSFYLTLMDDTVVSSAINLRPRPDAAMAGYLGGDSATGRFDFDVQRGQGAQFFP